MGQSVPSEPPFLDWCRACHEDGYFKREGGGWVVKCSKCEAETAMGTAREAAIDWNKGKVEQVTA